LNHPLNKQAYLPAGAAGASAGAAGASAGAAGASAGAAGAAGAGSSAFLHPTAVRANATISNNERIIAVNFLTLFTSFINKESKANYLCDTTYRKILSSLFSIPVI
jgi:hypothetical protein